MQPGLLFDGDMGCPAEHLALGDALPARNRVEPDNFGLAKGGLAFDAVAVDPPDVVKFLPGGFYQVP
jgi:hypothetical protein